MLATHLLCREIVVRAILRKGELDEDGRIMAHAFLRDPKRDPDGLSVNLLATTVLETWLSSFKKSYGADSLHCGRIRDLRLEVGQTAQDVASNSSHALIVGLPSNDEDPKKAEDLATELRNLARRLDRVIRRR